VAVLSQLGAVGCAMLAWLVVDIARPRRLQAALGARDAATVDSVRACALAGIVSASLISGTADPGMIFFISLAVVTASSIRVSLDRPAPAGNRLANPPNLTPHFPDEAKQGGWSFKSP
jgi:hypothetical protein